MKITEISCDQFAGIRDRQISLADGINVIYGKNESGKSTLVNLLYSLLFQDAKLDGRSNKDFKEQYFPTQTKAGTRTADSIDGKLKLTTENGAYTLTKVWGAEKECKLSAPENVFRSQDQVNEELKKVLQYGAGVYKDMLFASQHNMDLSLEKIMSAKDETEAKKELAKVLAQAFAEGDGITMDAIEKEIKAKIAEIEGKHWDAERERPQRNAEEWKRDVGEILKRYYALDKCNREYKEVLDAEENLKTAERNFNASEQKVQVAQNAYDAFNKYASQLKNYNTLAEAQERTKSDLKDATKAEQEWPLLVQRLATARALKTEQENRAKLDRFDKVKAIKEEKDKLEASIAGKKCPTDVEIKGIENANEKIKKLQNKLCGMNITAAIRMLNGQNVEIMSLRTGEPIGLTDDVANISEAVKITIPGVMEMQLVPADVDVADIESKIAEEQKKVETIFAAYAVHDIEKLRKLAGEVHDVEKNIAIQEKLLNSALGADQYEALEAEANTVPSNVRSKAEIDQAIDDLCMGRSVEATIGRMESDEKQYAEKYGSTGAMAGIISGLEEKLKKVQADLSAVENIPEEYRGISDSEEYLDELKKKLEDANKDHQNAIGQKASAEADMKDKDVEAAKEEKEDAERAFEEEKNLLKHWKHIEEVFQELKASVQNNPMQDLAESFTKYLSIISANRVSSESQNPNKLDVAIYSDGRLVDYGKLSEGTKETVSLAFRLAVLDHLFPDGGGVIVLDDPLTDMDAERVAQSCELIKKCAERHQVIFLTCREDYLNMLNGNVINL